MLRRFLNYQLSLTEPGKPLHRVRPLIQALDTFLYEPLANTTKAPFIRDSVDIKRWMILVVIALLPAIFMALCNTGLQSLVYSSGNAALMHEYLNASTSFSGYFTFVSHRVGAILLEGAKIFLPVVAISYAVGGACEALFACIRRHEINEGFLVTGILYPLILPPTIPYWPSSLHPEQLASLSPLPLFSSVHPEQLASLPPLPPLPSALVEVESVEASTMVGEGFDALVMVEGVVGVVQVQRLP